MVIGKADFNGGWRRSMTFFMHTSSPPLFEIINFKLKHGRYHKRRMCDELKINANQH